jgi:hypothetical protein
MLERLDFGDAVFHLRTPLAHGEEAMLPAEFMACPAVDIAGKTPLGFERSRERYALP